MVNTIFYCLCMKINGNVCPLPRQMQGFCFLATKYIIYIMSVLFSFFLRKGQLHNFLSCVYYLCCTFFWASAVRVSCVSFCPGNVLFLINKILKVCRLCGLCSLLFSSYFWVTVWFSTNGSSGSLIQCFLHVRLCQDFSVCGTCIPVGGG